MKQTTEIRKTGPQYRHLTVERAALNEEARTVELAFSSEEPYERFWGTEILDHAPSSVRLGRLKNGGALLLEHDPRRHIGVVEQVAIADDRLGRAVVRFGRSAEADAAWKDVQDGIRRHVSVGYIIHRMVLMEEKEGRETYRVDDWEPLEVSLVAIPADPSVGVGRSAEPDVSTIVVRNVADDEPQTIKEVIMTEEVKKQPEPADQERARVAAIMDIGQQYARYVSEKDVANAVRSGHSLEQFRETVMTRMESKHTDTREQHIGMSPKDVQRYSFGRAILAAMTGDWRQAGFERECSEAVAKMVGRSAEGFYVPFEAFQKRDFNVGTTSEAGNLVATDLRTDLYVDALRAAMVMAGLGVRFLPGLAGNVDVPRKATPGSLGMLTEIGSASETAPVTAKLTLSPKRIGAYTEYSKQALIQSAIPLEALIRDDLVTGAAVLLEYQMLNGAGTGAEIRGIRNTTGIGTVVGGTAGAAPTWAHFVDLESACANSNAEPDQRAGYLINTKTRGKAKQTAKGTNMGWIWDNGPQPINGYRAAVTNNIVSNLTKGSSTTVCSNGLFSADWSMWLVGLFGPPDVTVDPFTLAPTGQVRITLNQFADAGARQPAAFSKIDDWLAG